MERKRKRLTYGNDTVTMAGRTANAAI